MGEIEWLICDDASPVLAGEDPAVVPVGLPREVLDRDLGPLAQVQRFPLLGAHLIHEIAGQQPQAPLSAAPQRVVVAQLLARHVDDGEAPVVAEVDGQDDARAGEEVDASGPSGDALVAVLLQQRVEEGVEHVHALGGELFVHEQQVKVDHLVVQPGAVSHPGDVGFLDFHVEPTGHDAGYRRWLCRVARIPATRARRGVQDSGHVSSLFVGRQGRPHRSG